MPVGSWDLLDARKSGARRSLHLNESLCRVSGSPARGIGNPGYPDERTGYADSLFLPLALLRRMTFRPPGVLIRFKNPWVLFRFSLLG